MVNHIDIQHSILSSFLFANDLLENTDKAFIMDTEVFTTPLTKRIAEVINDETKSDKMYGFQSISIEDDIKGTQHEHEWLQIISQTPMSLSVASRLHEKLVKKMKQRIAMGVN